MRRRHLRSLRRSLKEATRSQQELQKRMFHLKALYDLSREVGFLLDTPRILGNLLLMVIGTFGTFRGLVVLVDTATGKVTAVTDRGLDSPAVDALKSAIESRSLAALPQSRLGLDALEAPRLGSEGDGLAQVLAPLDIAIWILFEVDQSLTGAIGLGEKLSGEPYTPDDEELLRTICNQAAVAIQNARRHEEVVRYADELGASLRRIQILESIRSNLAKFVPKTVQQLIEESPEAPSFDKREADVSVLFADITGYTRLSAHLALDQVNRLVERYFGAFLDEIMRHGGDVNETAGDGLMVIFRDPDPRGHARSAALTALAIQRRTAEINDELAGQFEPITMHVGVNSGIASVGATKIEGLAGTRWTYTASGPTTNIAARVAGLADGAAVLISEETRRRLGDGFAADDLGPQMLKNVAQPVRAYRLLPTVCAPAAGTVEQRRYPRRPVTWPVRIWVGAEAVAGHAVDASIHGICVATVPLGSLRPGQPCHVQLLLPGSDRAFRSAGEVRSVSDRGVAIETKEPLPLDDPTG